jgi:hypothetical protein
MGIATGLPNVAQVDENTNRFTPTSAIAASTVNVPMTFV